MDTKLAFTIFAGIMLILAIVSVIAAQESENESDVSPVPSTVLAPGSNGSGLVNMTYGRCVSDLTKTKNTCYGQMKQNSQLCKQKAEGQKQGVKTCNTNYSKDSKQCKQQFKDSKLFCSEYKKTFADKLKFWQ